jgi:hypothetical protein
VVPSIGSPVEFACSGMRRISDVQDGDAAPRTLISSVRDRWFF